MRDVCEILTYKYLVKQGLIEDTLGRRRNNLQNNTNLETQHLSNNNESSSTEESSQPNALPSNRNLVGQNAGIELNKLSINPSIYENSET